MIGGPGGPLHHPWEAGSPFSAGLSDTEGIGKSLFNLNALEQGACVKHCFKPCHCNCTTREVYALLSKLIIFSMKACLI